MKAIFLDIDGVLNNLFTDEFTPDGFVGISETLSDHLTNIIDTEPDVIKVVLSSSWKLMEEGTADYEYMMLRLSEADAAPIGFTEEPDEEGMLRGKGILNYLDEHEEITEFVILDDYIFDFEKEGLVPHLVLTNEIRGLTNDDVETAIAILNGKLLPDDAYVDVDRERGYYREG